MHQPTCLCIGPVDKGNHLYLLTYNLTSFAVPLLAVTNDVVKMSDKCGFRVRDRGSVRVIGLVRVRYSCRVISGADRGP